MLSKVGKVKLEPILMELCDYIYADKRVTGT